MIPNPHDLIYECPTCKAVMALEPTCPKCSHIFESEEDVEANMIPASVLAGRIIASTIDDDDERQRFADEWDAWRKEGG